MAKKKATPAAKTKAAAKKKVVAKAKPVTKTKVVAKAKPVAKTKPAPKKKAKVPAPAKVKKNPNRLSWLSEADTPLIENYAQQARSFLDAMADGVIDGKEIQNQETRLVALLKEVEPKLNDDLHEKVTRLLCELTVYDLMKVLNALQKKRPETKFQG